jgi:hypothetical protein
MVIAMKCVVCGSSDPRSLSTTRLTDGTCVDVCGSHALAHDRMGRTAGTILELVALTADRRQSPDRRSSDKDELAMLLDEAFAPRPARAATARRRSDRAS